MGVEIIQCENASKCVSKHYALPCFVAPLNSTAASLAPPSHGYASHHLLRTQTPSSPAAGAGLVGFCPVQSVQGARQVGLLSVQAGGVPGLDGRHRGRQGRLVGSTPLQTGGGARLDSPVSHQSVDGTELVGSASVQAVDCVQPARPRLQSPRTPRPACLLIVQGLQLAGPVPLGQLGLPGAAPVRVNSLSPLSPLQAGVPAHQAAPLPLQAALDLRPPGQSLSQLVAERLDLALQVLELPLPHAGLGSPAPQRGQHQPGRG